jgi:hypothetical protein
MTVGLGALTTRHPLSAKVGTTSQTSGGRSVCIVRSRRPKSRSLVFLVYIYVCVCVCVYTRTMYKYMRILRSSAGEWFLSLWVWQYVVYKILQQG